MVTKEEVNVVFWSRIDALASSGTLPITGNVYNGQRDIKNISQDITVNTTVVTDTERAQRADVNINVFADDIKKGGNVYVTDEETLGELSRAVLNFIQTIDTIPSYALIDYTERTIEEPALHQHYCNFLIRIYIYDD